MKTYTAGYFIDIFAAIPDELWCIGTYNGQNDSHCATGHLMSTTEAGKQRYKYTDNNLGLELLLKPIVEFPSALNDGGDSPIDREKDNRYMRFGKTPKERIINGLKSLSPTRSVSFELATRDRDKVIVVE